MRVAAQAVFIMPGGQFKSLRSLNCPSCLDHLHSKRAAAEESGFCTGGHVKKPILQHRADSIALMWQMQPNGWDRQHEKPASNWSASLFNHSNPRQDKMGRNYHDTQFHWDEQQHQQLDFTMQQSDSSFRSLFPVSYWVRNVCVSVSKGGGREILKRHWCSQSGTLIRFTKSNAPPQ